LLPLGAKYTTDIVIVQKSSIIDHVLNWAKFKADQEIKKTDGSKRSR